MMKYFNWNLSALKSLTLSIYTVLACTMLVTLFYVGSAHGNDYFRGSGLVTLNENLPKNTLEDNFSVEHTWLRGSSRVTSEFKMVLEVASPNGQPNSVNKRPRNQEYEVAEYPVNRQRSPELETPTIEINSLPIATHHEYKSYDGLKYRNHFISKQHDSSTESVNWKFEQRKKNAEMEKEQLKREREIARKNRKRQQEFDREQRKRMKEYKKEQRKLEHELAKLY